LKLRSYGLAPLPGVFNQTRGRREVQELVRMALREQAVGALVGERRHTSERDRERSAESHCAKYRSDDDGH
jgi:hypothetical protein